MVNILGRSLAVVQSMAWLEGIRSGKHVPLASFTMDRREDVPILTPYARASNSSRINLHLQSMQN